MSNLTNADKSLIFPEMMQVFYTPHITAKQIIECNVNDTIKEIMCLTAYESKQSHIQDLVDSGKVSEARKIKAEADEIKSLAKDLWPSVFNDTFIPED